MTTVTVPGGPMPPGARPVNYAARFIAAGWLLVTDNTNRYTDMGWLALRDPATGASVTVHYLGGPVILKQGLQR